jgi:hypothetical protein
MNRHTKILASSSLLLAASFCNAQTTELDGKWVLAVGEDAASYEVVASLQQESANTIKDEYATKDINPRLAFRCAPGNPEISVRIDWRRFISSFNSEVGFKADDSKTLWQKWGVDQSNKITLSKSTADSQSLVGYLTGGSSLQVEVSPYSEPPVTVEYDLAGLSAALEALRAECQ